MTASQLLTLLVLAAVHRAGDQVEVAERVDAGRAERLGDLHRSRHRYSGRADLQRRAVRATGADAGLPRGVGHGVHELLAEGEVVVPGAHEGSDLVAVGRQTGLLEEIGPVADALGADVGAVTDQLTVGARPALDDEVDDDRAVRESLRRSLQFNGYQVETAGDGMQALESVTAARPDAMVLDVMMPRLDGLEVCRRLRSTGDDLPILVLTARGSWHETVEGIDSGGDDYVSKPFRMEEVLARLRGLIRRALWPHREFEQVRVAQERVGAFRSPERLQQHGRRRLALPAEQHSGASQRRNLGDERQCVHREDRPRRFVEDAEPAA